MLLSTRTRPRSRVDSRLASYGVLGAGALAVALVAALTGLQVTIHSLDETVYKFAAVQMANDVPFGVFNEHTSRGVARLYSLLVSPLFDVFAGDVAIRLARALNSVLFAATAVPVALLARRVTASPWSGAAAGVLSVAVPWLTLATIMFSESLAYLLFACAVLAMVRAVEAPSWQRDLVVVALLLALVFTRVQFVVLLPAWALIVLVAERRRWRSFPVTAGGTALAVVGALGLIAVGVFSGRLRDLAGPYYEIIRRDGVPGNFGLAFLWEVEMLALGVGLLPAVLAAAWYARAVGRREEDAAGFRFAGVVLVAIGVLFAATLWAQGGFLEWRSEERYFIYAVPFLWIGAVAALERADLPRGWIAAAGAALLFVLFTVPIASNGSGEQAFLGPVSMSAAHLLPRLEQDLSDALGLAGAFTPRDLLGLACVLLVGLGIVLWRRGPRARRIALIPAVALQLFVASYAFAGVYGELDGLGGLTPDIPFSDLGWVDRGTPGDVEARLLDNQSDGREGLQRNTVFWNDEVTSLYRLGPAGVAAPGFPVFTLPTAFSDVTPELRLTVPLPEFAVTAVDSPLWQIAGQSAQRSPDGALDLIRPVQPGQVTWMTQGLDTDGHVVRPVTLRALGGRRVTLEAIAPRDDQESAARIRLAGVDEELRFGPGRPNEQRVTADLCDAAGPVEGTIEQVNSADIGNNRFSGARVLRVRLDPC